MSNGSEVCEWLPNLITSPTRIICAVINTHTHIYPVVPGISNQVFYRKTKTKPYTELTTTVTTLTDDSTTDVRCIVAQYRVTPVLVLELNRSQRKEEARGNGKDWRRNGNG